MGADKEEAMSNLRYETVDLEEATTQQQVDARQHRPRPFLVVNNQAGFGDSLSGGVSDVIDYVLAQGSMPA
jgi:hypothetical protein